MRDEQTRIETPGPAEEPLQTNPDPWAARLTEKQWRALEIAGGIVLGVAGALCLFYLGGTETFGSVGLLAAIAIMLLLPNVLHTSLGRDLRLGRLVSIAAFALVLLVYFLLNWPK